ncbi:hypothetical protein [Streptomyces sp. NPDC000229]
MPGPTALVDCAATSASDLTTLVDPSSITVPSKVPAASCLAV